MCPALAGGFFTNSDTWESRDRIDHIKLGGAEVKHLPAMQETRVQSLGREDALEKEMTTHSSNLAWRIPWSEEPGRLQPTGLQRVGNA